MNDLANLFFCMPVACMMVSTGICICLGKKVQLFLVGGCRVWNKFAFFLLRMFETATGKITNSPTGS